MTAASPPSIVLSPADHAVLGQEEFGAPGLLAVESIGPFTRVRACGPLVTVHDSVIAAGLGIGHHPHRYHERLFCVERGAFDHDDARNGITGHVPEGALARFTEGRGGMVHQEWNHGAVDAEIFILVAATDPIPEDTSFEVLPREAMPVYAEAPGVVTREMVGARSPLLVHCDVRLFADTTLQPGAGTNWRLQGGEGALLSVREGAASLDGTALSRKWTMLLPPAPEPRELRLASPDGARVLRAAFGPGYGLVTAR